MKSCSSDGPSCVVIDYPHVIALLQNNTVEVHSLITQEIVQVIQATGSMRPKQLSSLSTSPTSPAGNIVASPRLDTFQPKALVTCSAGFPGRQYSSTNGETAFSPLLVPQVSGLNSVEKVPIRFFPEKSLLDEPNEPESAEDALPSTPKRSMSGLAASRPAKTKDRSSPVSTVAANTLLLGRDSVFALCPLTLVTQAEALIASSKVEEALALLAAVGTPDTPEKVSRINHKTYDCDVLTPWPALRVLLHTTESCLDIRLRDQIQGSRSAVHSRENGSATTIAALPRLGRRHKGQPTRRELASI